MRSWIDGHREKELMQLRKNIFLMFMICLGLLAGFTSAQSAGSLEPTLELRDTTILNGETAPIAWQSGLPLPSFEPQMRTQIDLSGEWRKERFKADHDLTMDVRTAETLGALETEAGGRYLADYDDSAWQTIMLPAVENTMPIRSGSGRGPENYENGVWYRRTIDVPQDWDNTAMTLNFLAVNYVVDVWVNSQWVGYHEGGFTPFALNVAPFIKVGEANQIALRVDNPPWGTRTDTVPAIKSDWFNYTGVIHGLYLQSTPQVYIVRADVLTPNLSGNVHVSAVVYNDSNTPQSALLTLTLHETNPESAAWLTDAHASAIADNAIGESQTFTVDVPPGEAIVVQTTMQINNPKLWAIRQPNLYVLQASLDNGDAFATQFGIRTIGTESTHVLLNGEPTFLAGIARHEDSPDRGRTMTWERILSDFQIIDDLNANFVRTAHYPNHGDTYIILDRLGLTAAVEIPLWQTTEVEFGVQEQRRIADQMWREMILSERNRPSIIFWSSNNESREVPVRTAYIERLLADFRENLDDHRIVIQSAAADRDGPRDASQTPLEVAGWTMYFGIFHGSTYYEGTADFLKAAHAAFPDKPILNTEYGIWSLGGNSSNTRQKQVFTDTFKALTEVSAWDAAGTYNPEGYVAGITWWAAFDWYTAISKLQTMGVYEMDRTRAKPVAELLRQAYKVWNPLR
jgi:beta-galactosidase